MLGLVRTVSYIPIIKWKTGERLALSTLRGASRRQLMPLFLMPPSSDFDHEKGRPLTPLEHIKLFGKRLHVAWGRSPVFVDAGGIDDRHHEGLADHPLTELLARARIEKSLACPATTMTRSSDYQDAVRRFTLHNPDLPICIRIMPLDMESTSFAADLLALLERLGTRPERAVLVLDFAPMGALKLSETEPFAELLAERIYNLPSLFQWLKVVVALTSFPAMLKMKPNETKIFPRTDWMTYKSLIEREPDLLPRVAFGDYAIDAAPFGKKVRVIPSAHFRYTSAEHYLVVKGQQAKKPLGFNAIRPVAATLAQRGEFVGAAFSEGDSFINRLATGDPDTTTGNAATWRWAGTDHHFAQVFDDLRLLAGQQHEDVLVEADEQVQESLF